MDTKVNWLTVHQAAEILGIKPGSVRARARAGTLRARKSARGKAAVWQIAAADLLVHGGLRPEIARYFCQYFPQHLKRDFREIAEEVGEELLARAMAEIMEKVAVEVEAIGSVMASVAFLQRELGEKDAQLQNALAEIERLTGDVGAVVGELGRPARRNEANAEKEGKPERVT